MSSLLRPWLLVVSLFIAYGAHAQTVTVDTTNSPYVVSSPATFAQLTIAAGGVLVANSPVMVSGDLRVLAGGVVAVNPAISHTVRLTVTGALQVNSGGAIDLTGKGLAPLTTISPGSGAVTPYAGCERCGGSHFTRGAGQGNTAGPPTFDEPTNPQYPGGGGVEGRGGGVVLATAARSMVESRSTARTC